MYAPQLRTEKVLRIKASVLAARDQLQKLQYFQLLHDEIYHKDIGLLRIQARIAHHTLHLGKYAGKMVSALVANGGINYSALAGTVLDAIIIVMSSANTLNMPLWELKGADEDLIGVLAGKQTHGDPQVHILGYTVVMGRLAKAVEALDHVENTNSRAMYEDGLRSMWRLLLTFWRVLTSERLHYALKQRMYAIESRNMFYGRYPSYENGFKPVLQDSCE